MNAALLRHAIANIWCNPGQDRQYVYRMKNLSPRLSFRNRIVINHESVPLPTQGDRYHVYQLGKVLPKNIGVPHTFRQWLRLSDLAEENLLYTELYTASGIQYPRFQGYFWLTPSRNLIIAVKEERHIGMLYNVDLYLRVYTNAFFHSPRSEGRRYIYLRGIKVKNNDHLIAFQQSIARIVSERGGYPYYIVNGRVCHNISLVTAGPDDLVEFVLDGSVKRMVEFDIVNQPTFTSTLDKMHKYILHYDDPSVDTIEYLDDVDAVMLNPGINNRFMGVLYHRNHPTWLRMLTHKDYSAPVSRFKEFVTTHPSDPRHQIDPNRWPSDQWTSVNGKRLRLYIRDSGYERPLVANANRIQELYRLDSERIVRAMRGLDATVDVWRAENLESSPYIQFMSLSPEKIYPKTYQRVHADSTEKRELQDMVGKAYGYHAAATVLAGTPQRTYVKNGVRYADLPHEHQKNATVFEYNTTGELIGWYRHVEGEYYLVRNDNCTLVEAIGGRGSKRPHTHYGTGLVELTTGYNFRVYVRPTRFGVPQGDWQDITDRDDRGEWGFWDNTALPHRWVWTKSGEYEGAVREDRDFLCYDLSLIRGDGHLRFSLEVERQDGSGVWGSHTLDIPYGQLDVFLNGRALAEGIDYVVRYPEIVICNKEYLSSNNTQRLTIRHFGFAKGDMSRLPHNEVSFVTYGVLSRNDRYDIHTNKVLRVVVDGRYFHKDDIVFDEAKENYVIEGVRNGAPYFIQSPPVIFREVYPSDIQARQADDLIDKSVSDYMSEYFPLKHYDHPDYIERKYQVISPFANKLLHDLKMGWFYPPGIEGHYSRQDIRSWCKDYEWLLAYDLCNTDYDKVRINIRPHWHDEPVDLNAFKYQFFYRVLETYLRHPPDLSPYITISK